MAIYKLIDKATTTSSIPTTTSLQAPQYAIGPFYQGAGGINVTPVQQTFQLNVSGTGSVAATAQPVVSNDGVNWANYGSAISANGTTSATAIANGTQQWPYYSAYMTTLTGTGAKATLLVNV